jgi:hypothetical protein
MSPDEILNSDSASIPNASWTLEPYKNGLVLNGNLQISSNRTVALTIYCQINSSNSNFLISEKHSIQSNPDALITFDYDNLSNSRKGMNFAQPTISLSGVTYGVAAENINFQNLVNGMATISLNIPQSLLLNSAGGQVQFEPNLAHFLWPLWSVETKLPSADLIGVALKNCF